MRKLDFDGQMKEYLAYLGKNVEQMPQIIADGRTPMSVADIMRRRLEVTQPEYSENVKQNWWNTFFDTCDAVAFHPDKKIKIILNAQQIKEINTKSQLVKGALKMEDGLFEALDGEEISEKTLREQLDYQHLQANWAKKVAFTVRFVNNDRTLLENYVKAMEREQISQVGYNLALTFVCVPAEFEKVPVMRIVRIGSVSDSSLINASSLLNWDQDVLMGYKPVSFGPSQEQIMKTLQQNLGNIPAGLEKDIRDLYSNLK